MSDVNIPLLRKAVEWAEAEAMKPWELSEWSQGNWIASPSSLPGVLPSMYEVDTGRAREGQKKSTDCGTCYCVAGFISVQVQGIEPELASDVEGIAAEALGISDSLADRLFAPHNSIEAVRRIAESIAGEHL